MVVGSLRLEVSYLTTIEIEFTTYDFEMMSELMEVESQYIYLLDNEKIINEELQDIYVY